MIFKLPRFKFDLVICTRVILFLNLILANNLNALHIRGTFNTNEFFKFITRFGFQSTDVHNNKETRGYIYGNITLLDSTDPNSNNFNYKFPRNSLIMLTVMDYNFFIDYYNRRRIMPKHVACPLMFENIKKIAYFFECNENNTEDFIRRVPCESNKYCIDEDNKDNVIKGNQFTFKIQDFNQARFWYISLVACTRDTKTCEWRDLSYRDRPNKMRLDQDLLFLNKTNTTFEYSTSTSPVFKQFPSFTLAYDIWFVNGDPESNTRNNHFEHQFSYELHDIFEIYLCSLIVNSFILPIILFRIYSHFHYLYLQLLVYVGIEFTSRFLSLIHTLIFSFNGYGLYFFQSLSDFCEALASSILMLILLSIAKGWTIRSSRLKTSNKFYAFGFLLQFVLVVSHMISLNTIDPVFNTNSYETVAGYIELSIRFVCMIWFLFELRETFDHLETAAFKNTKTLNSESVETNDDIIELDEDDYEKVKDGKRYFNLVEQQQNHDMHINQLNGKQSQYQDSNLSKKERFIKYQKFYLHYGACCLVWFIYLPILIFITSFVTELYRLRLVLSIRYFVNFIVSLVLIYIMWSRKTPLKLPGKESANIYEQLNLQYLFYQTEEEDENNESVIFRARDIDIIHNVK